MAKAVDPPVINPEPDAPRTGFLSTGKLPGWFKQKGEQGGLWFQLVRVEPVYEQWPKVACEITDAEIASHGPGIYDILCFRENQHGKLARASDPKRVELPGWEPVAKAAQPAAPPVGQGPDASMVWNLARELEGLRGELATRGLAGGTQIPVDTVDAMRREHDAQLDAGKRSADDRIAQLRAQFEDRLSANKALLEARSEMAEERARAANSRADRLTDEVDALRRSLREAEKRQSLPNQLNEYRELREAVEALSPKSAGGGDEETGMLGAASSVADKLFGFMDRMDQRQRGQLEQPNDQAPQSTNGAGEAQTEPSPPAVLVAAIGDVYAAAGTPGTAADQIAPRLERDAVVMLAKMPADELVTWIHNLAAWDSPLRVPEALPWIAELQLALVVYARERLGVDVEPKGASPAP